MGYAEPQACEAAHLIVEARIGRRLQELVQLNRARAVTVDEPKQPDDLSRRVYQKARNSAGRRELGERVVDWVVFVL